MEREHGKSGWPNDFKMFEFNKSYIYYPHFTLELILTGKSERTYQLKN